MELMICKRTFARGRTHRKAVRKHAPILVALPIITLYLLISSACAAQSGIQSEEDALAARYAIGRSDFEKFQSLVTSRSDAIREVNQSPLWLYTLRFKKPEFLKHLLDLGTNPNTVDTLGLTMLHWAVLYGFPEGVRLLVEAGADIEKENPSGSSPLFAAVSAQDYQIVSLLLSHDADINRVRSNGNTPLMRALIARNQEIVRLLVQSGADPSIADYFGHTEETYARKRNILHWLNDDQKEDDGAKP